jgi:hypothetical protein
MIGFLYESFWVIQEEDDERDFSGFLMCHSRGSEEEEMKGFYLCKGKGTVSWYCVNFVDIFGFSIGFLK